MENQLNKKSVNYFITVNRIPALAAILGPLVFGAIEIVAVVNNPLYSPFRESVSDLGLGPNGWIQSTGFYVFSVLYIIFIIGLYRNLNNKITLKVATAINIYIGLGFLLIALFQTDSAGFRYYIHLYVSASVMGIFPLSCFFYLRAMRATPGWKVSFFATLAAGIISVVICTSPLQPPTQWIEFPIFERALMINTALWIEVVGFNLWRNSSENLRNSFL